jgi:hypothetical protein
MPFNADDYTKAPFANGLMFDPTTEETEVLYVQDELKDIAQEISQDYYSMELQNRYNTYPDRWEKGEWINGDTAEFCFYYQPQPVEETPAEEPTEEPTEEQPVEEETPVEEEPPAE